MKAGSVAANTTLQRCLLQLARSVTDDEQVQTPSNPAAPGNWSSGGSGQSALATNDEDRFSSRKYDLGKMSAAACKVS